MSTASAAPAPRAAAPASRPRSALGALTRAEGRRLLRHPVFLLGLVTTTATLVVANGNSPNAGGVFQQEIADFLAGNCFTLAGGAVWTFLATFLAVSRERRDAAEELYAGQPATPRARTAAALLSVGYAGLAAAVLIGAATLVFLGPDAAHDVLGRRVAVSPLELAQGPLLVVLAGTLGVLIGSWARYVLVALFVAVLMVLAPVTRLTWLVFDSADSRAVFGDVDPGLPAGWHLLALAGLIALAASLAMARHDRRLRIGLLACAGLAATAAVAFAAPTNSLVASRTAGAPVASCAPPEASTGGSPGVVAGRGTPGNFDFERGDLHGWHVQQRGSGAWRIYTDAKTPPDRSDSDLTAPFDVIDPPQGRFAAVTDMCTAGSRILYRDVKLAARSELRFTLFYRSVEPLTSSQTLDHLAPFANVQFRVDVMDPRAPLESLAPSNILATVFRTTPGDDLEAGPRRVTFDLSPWAGQTVRLRFAQVDNVGPLRVVIDDVKLDPARS
jgi:hypothetical protein